MPKCPTAGLHLIIVATGLLAAATALRPDPAHAQSFDCRQARHQDEMVICQQPALARFDQQLATLYREQIAKIPKERQDEFQQHEALFLNARRKCGGDSRCIEQSYRNRIKEFGDFVSEAKREESDRDMASADANPERLVRPRDRRSTRSERPLEPSGSSDPAAPQVQSRSESDTTTANPPVVPEPQSTEASRKATRTSEHRSKRSQPSATAAASQSPASTSDNPAKPAIQWVDPPPVR